MNILTTAIKTQYKFYTPTLKRIHNNNNNSKDIKYSRTSGSLVTCVLSSHKLLFDTSEACFEWIYEWLRLVYYPVFRLGHLLTVERCEKGLHASAYFRLTNPKIFRWCLYKKLEVKKVHDYKRGIRPCGTLQIQKEIYDLYMVHDWKAFNEALSCFLKLTYY